MNLWLRQLFDEIGRSRRSASARRSQVPPSPPKSPGVATLIGTAVGFLALAAALRAPFLYFGLPYIYHPDEPTNLAVVQRLLAQSDLNPHFFNYPSLLFYLNLPGQYWIAWRDGGLAPFAMQSTGNGLASQPEAFLAARAVTLLFGLAILPLLFVWARALALGFWALAVLGVLFCLEPLLLRPSTLITPDVFAAFFSTGALWGCSLVVLRGDRFAYGVASVMAGLAASSKYNAGLVVVALALAHLLRHGGSISKARPLGVAALVAAVAFLAGSPFIALDPVAAASGILGEMRHYRTGHTGHEGHSLAANAEWIFDDFGWAAGLAVASCWAPRARALMPTLLFVVAYFALLSIQFVRFERNLIPLAPALLLLVAAGVEAILSKLAVTLPGAASWVGLVTAGLALALFGAPAAQSLAEAARYQADPRAEARAWLDSRLPRTMARKIAVEPYTPFVAESGRSVVGLGLVGDMEPEALASFSHVVISNEGSGRFLQGPYERQRVHLAALRARACDRWQFPAGSAQPDYTVFVMTCD